MKKIPFPVKEPDAPNPIVLGDMRDCECLSVFRPLYDNACVVQTRVGRLGRGRHRLGSFLASLDMKLSGLRAPAHVDRINCLRVVNCFQGKLC